MPDEKYLSAASKHLHDAELLVAAGRPDNAAYLSGYVAECALKGLLHAQHGFSGRGFGHDLPALSRAATSFAVALSPVVKRYIPPAGPDAASLLSAWAPDMRYQADQTIPEPTARMWLRAANSFHREIIVPMRLDGFTDPI
jgi:HEPN domain-containing protein